MLAAHQFFGVIALSISYSRTQILRIVYRVLCVYRANTDIIYSHPSVTRLICSSVVLPYFSICAQRWLILLLLLFPFNLVNNPKPSHLYTANFHWYQMTIVEQQSQKTVLWKSIQKTDRQTDRPSQNINTHAHTRTNCTIEIQKEPRPTTKRNREKLKLSLVVGRVGSV